MREQLSMRTKTSSIRTGNNEKIPDPRGFVDSLMKRIRRRVMVKSIAGAVPFIAAGIGGGMIAGFCVKRGIIRDQTVIVTAAVIGAVLFPVLIYCFYRYIRASIEEDEDQ